MSRSELENLTYEAVRQVIRQRKTTKVFASVEQPLNLDPRTIASGDAIVMQSIADAGWAPFHFDRKVDGIAEPWRVYWMKTASCRHLSQHLAEWFSEMKPGNKMPALLAACGCVVIVTWIPQRPTIGEDPIKLVSVNEEHLAASAAFVQNLLLLLEAAGLRTYWSSGGLLKSQTASDKLGIPQVQQMLACVFVDYANDDETRSVEVAGGGQRERRSPALKWTNEIQLV